MHKALLLVMALAACGQQTGMGPDGAIYLDATTDVDPRDACGASELQQLVGKAAGILDSIELPAGTRVVGPDEAMTMDYNPERLNIQKDREGYILRVHCG